MIVGEWITPKDDFAEKVCSDWNPSPTRWTYASFGDKGVTASVNDYGSIIQFGRYLGAAKSGMFCVDHKAMHPPYWVKDRALKLQEFYGDQSELSYGTRFDEIFGIGPPYVTYICDRWPRYVYAHQSRRCRVSVQWMVHEGTVLQQCIAHNTSDDKVNFRFSFR
jgi:hypothetical protein